MSDHYDELTLPAGEAVDQDTCPSCGEELEIVAIPEYGPGGEGRFKDVCSVCGYATEPLPAS